MRIGQVNQDNYKEMLKLFGGNNSKSLDNLLGKDKENKYAKTQDEEIAMLVKQGYMLEGTFAKEGDDSWKKIIPVSDDIKNKLIETVRRQFTTNANGMSEARDGDELGTIMQEYLKSIPPSERLSAGWTLTKVTQTENQRMVDYVKANAPGWQHGQAIPSDILKAAVSGNHVDIKA